MVLLLTVVVFIAIYAVAILGLVAALRRLRIGGDRTVALGFLILGAVHDQA